jgi:hypothetical protein
MKYHVLYISAVELKNHELAERTRKKLNEKGLSKIVSVGTCTFIDGEAIPDFGSGIIVVNPSGKTLYNSHLFPDYKANAHISTAIKRIKKDLKD